jgi:hypothetical protein
MTGMTATALPTASNEFRIPTRWRVRGRIGDVADILSDPLSFPRWWGQVYLGVQRLSSGDADGIGQRIAVHSRGWLPYHLHWTGTLVAADLPHRWTIRAEGDLTGIGHWHLTQDGDDTDIRFDWSVAADRPILRALSPVLKPLFAWNHRWAMARGLEGLKRELASRGA